MRQTRVVIITNGINFLALLHSVPGVLQFHWASVEQLGSAHHRYVVLLTDLNTLRHGCLLHDANKERTLSACVRDEWAASSRSRPIDLHLKCNLKSSCICQKSPPRRRQRPRDAYVITTQMCIAPAMRYSPIYDCSYERLTRKTLCAHASAE